jgi:hypothetical protein
METPVSKKPVAWQPLTPRGVAVFAAASVRRLFLAQFLVALIAAVVVVWFLHSAWFSVADVAIGRLPETGEIRFGRLNWQESSSVLLAEGRCIAFAVDLEHRGYARSPAHVEVEFGRADVQVSSLYGFSRLGYPQNQALGFNRIDVAAWWGAWRPAILGLTALGVIAGLIASWAVLATVYSPVAWAVATFADRPLTLSQSWRLAGAALMPGALLMSAALFGYGMGVLDLITFTIAAAGHFLVGWIYVIMSPFWLPRLAVSGAAPNPFQPLDAPADKPKIEPPDSAPPPAGPAR